MRKKILIIFGTRPEAIKMAPVVKELEKYPDKFEPIVCVTGQHREMLDQVLNIFSIKTNYDLNIMEKNQSLYDITSKSLDGIKRVIQKEKPDFVLVQGDTTTTFVGSLAGFYSRIPVGHIEAGLRTYNKYRPFPEEINRRLTSHIADLHFAPTERSKENLLIEGIEEEKIFVTGNTVIDALLIMVEKQSSTESQEKWERYFDENIGVSFNNRKQILVTAHRRESFEKDLENIFNALKEIATSNDVDIIYPVHPNPEVRKRAKKILNNVKNVYLIPPLDYEPFIYLMSKAYIILTDSGGIQEEAPSLGKPVLVLREVTERPEAVESGAARIVGTNQLSVVEWTNRLLNNHEEYGKMAQSGNPYGDGCAAQRIVSTLIK